MHTSSANEKTRCFRSSGAEVSSEEGLLWHLAYSKLKASWACWRMNTIPNSSKRLWNNPNYRVGKTKAPVGIMKNSPKWQLAKSFPLRQRAHGLSALTGWVLIRWKDGAQFKLNRTTHYILFLKLVCITFPWISGQKPGSAQKKVVTSCVHHFEMQSFLRQVLY